MRAAIITVSTSKSHGDGVDESGRALADLARSAGAEIAGAEIIPDDRDLIEARLRHWADEVRCDLVLTTGGTGFTPTDVTPEATQSVIERAASGLPEAMRAATLRHTPHAILSRAVAGIRGRTLIVNFPGSPAGVRECFDTIAESLPHAVSLLRGGSTAHAAQDAPPGDGPGVSGIGEPHPRDAA